MTCNHLAKATFTLVVFTFCGKSFFCALAKNVPPARFLNAQICPFTTRRLVNKKGTLNRVPFLLVPVTLSSRLNSDISGSDSKFDSISTDFHAIARLFAFIYSSATARCSFRYFSNTEQYVLSVMLMSVCPRIFCNTFAGIPDSIHLVANV